MNSEKNHKKWWQMQPPEIAEFLKTDLKKGLPSDEAEIRLKKFGLNELPQTDDFSAIKLLVDQFSSTYVKVLLVAIGISCLLSEWLDALAIGIIVVVNAFLGFIQEYKAHQSLLALRKLAQPQSRVIRGSRATIIASHRLVQGDVVELEAGDKVPADGRIIQLAQLVTVEAALTGESQPVSKITEPISDNQLPIGDIQNMVFMGTNVVAGKALILITETGLHTELGKLAELLTEEPEEKIPLQIKLEQLGKVLLISCLTFVTVIFLFGFIRGLSLVSLSLTTLSLAVAAIPEGLPSIVTIALSIGARRMAKNNALIRKLASVETLGRVSVICTDKTGTLTQNSMEVRTLWIAPSFIEVSHKSPGHEVSFFSNDHKESQKDKADLLLLLKIITFCSTAEIKKNSTWEPIGEPTETALLMVAEKAGITKYDLFKEHTIIAEFPFDSQRKRMSVVIRSPHAPRLVAVKGAPEIIINHCSKILIHNEAQTLTADEKKTILNANSTLAHKALRVIGIAYKYLDPDEEIRDDVENNLIFIGLVGMMDPLRKEAKSAIEKCKSAGIKPVMITGDHKETALAIAKELNLLEKDSLIVDGVELQNMSDDELRQQVKKISVYARTSGEQKLKIIHAWKSVGEIVAMTGDGVNDAPAMKAADIGVAMGSGTEVTKEVADMILLDNNFATIVKAVEEGRRIFDNIVKFVSYMISTNAAELLIIFFPVFLGFKDVDGKPFVSLLPIQLLWINLVTDGFAGLALSLDPLDPNAMNAPPKKPSDPILSLQSALQFLLSGLVMALAGTVICYLQLGKGATLVRTMIFTLLIFLEFIRIYAVRQNYNVTFLSNPFLLFSIVCSVTLQIFIVYTSALQNIFKTQELGLTQWVLIMGAVTLVWLFNMLFRFLTGRKQTVFQK